MLKKVASMIFSALLVVAMSPSLGFAEDNDMGDSVEDGSIVAADNNRNTENTPVVPDDKPVEQIEALSLLDYVIIEMQEVSIHDEQTIVIGFSDESFSIKSARLFIENAVSGECFTFDMTKQVPGAVLFSFAGDKLREGAYRLSALEYIGASNELEIHKISFSGDKNNGYTFFIKESAINDLKVSDSGDLTTTFVLSDAGILNSQENIEEAISTINTTSSFSSRATRDDGSMVVALDPGHGGYDGGAQGFDLIEKNLNLRIAEFCKAELERYYGVTVYMTRTTDEYVGLTERVDRAVAAGADVFVSLHVNSAVNPAGHGAEVIVPNDSSYYYQETHLVGTQLGEKILAQITALGISERYVYSKDATNDYRYDDGSLGDYFTVIAEAREHGIPGIIVEHAFISNPSDASFLGNENNLKALGIADAEGIAKQYGLRVLVPLYGFSDVYEVTSHAQETGWLVSAGVSSGYDDGTFRPYDGVARCDMAAFLYRMAGSPSFTPSASDMARFSDVDSSTPHAKEVWWLASQGVSSGYDDGTFRPYDGVSRCDMAAFLHRYYYLFDETAKNWVTPESGKLRFSDVDLSTPHAEDVWWLAAQGVSIGYDDGTFRPYEGVTRCDMAAFLYRTDLRLNRESHFVSSKSIMGASTATAEQMASYFKSVEGVYPTGVYREKGASTIEDFARLVVWEANLEGVRAEVVFCQAMKETGWLKFGGQVKVEQCNFAGLGATNDGAAGASFKDVQIGIRAQVQHLKAYASNEPLMSECVDPRFSLVERGCAPLVTDLNGRWAVPGDGYGERILAMVHTLLSY